MSEPRICSHYKFPIKAPDYIWESLGWTVYANTNVVSSRSYSARDDSDELLALALTMGLTDEKALGFYAEEHHRRSEEQTRSTAIARQAESITKLAESLRSESDKSVLSRIMSNLTESTQWAVRQQLKGMGILPDS